MRVAKSPIRLAGMLALAILAVFCVAGSSHAQSNCTGCHSKTLANAPVPFWDVPKGLALPDYLPPSLVSPLRKNYFYGINAGHANSLHAQMGLDCTSCHTAGGAHTAGIPFPNSSACVSCHPFAGYGNTRHFNANNRPWKYFDQAGSGKAQATTILPEADWPVALFKANKITPVSKDERIAECSSCHAYGRRYSKFANRIMKPEVSCGACHDAHMNAPKSSDRPEAGNTVSVVQMATETSSTVTQVAEAEGRKVSYRNLKPVKAGIKGAFDLRAGIWTRGSTIARPGRSIVQGTGSIEDGEGKSNVLKVPAGVSLDEVKKGHVLFIVDSHASGQVTLPGDAQLAGEVVTVDANFKNSGIGIESVDKAKREITLETTTDSGAVSVLGTDKLGLVLKTTVTYTKTAGGTGTRAVYIPLTDNVQYQIKDMYTNTETLCAGCHSQGSLFSTAWGKNPVNGTFTALGKTHNKDIFTQYKNSPHGKREGAAFEEFRAGLFNNSHQQIYPLDMSISGQGRENSLRNAGSVRYTVTPAQDFPPKVYVSAPVAGTYACNQCHHGLGSIDFMKDRQGTEDAQVLWGDATVTCITCHETHNPGAGKSVRKPEKLSFNAAFVAADVNPRGGINKMMDGTDIPSGAGRNTLCLFCHQGRESGLTLFKGIKNADSARDPYSTDPTEQKTVINAAGSGGGGMSFMNSHYLAAGAILWSKNLWEYSNGDPDRYSSGNTSHQWMNCGGCHIGEANTAGTAGGHTFTPKIETCVQCHGPVDDFLSIASHGDYDGNGTAGTIGEELGSASAGTGLLGQVKMALRRPPDVADASAGIHYDPGTYPYFYIAKDIASSSAGNAGTVRITTAKSHGLSTGGTVKIIDHSVASYNGTWKITKIDATNFDLDTSVYSDAGTGGIVNTMTAFKRFTVPQLTAAFNLNLIAKANNGFVHNARYVVQILQDSLSALGAAPAGYRPAGDRPAVDYRNFDFAQGQYVP